MTTKEMIRCKDCCYLFEDNDGNWCCADFHDRDIHTIANNECELMQD